MDKVRVRVRRKYRNRRIGCAFAGIVIIAAIIFVIIKCSGYTAEMVSGEMNVSMKKNAVIIRDETVFTAASYSRADYLVPEGSMVSEGTPVMTVYKQGYNEGIGSTLQQISEEVYAAQLAQLGNTKDSKLAEFNEDIDTLEAKIASAVMNSSGDSIIELEKLLAEKMEDRSEYLKETLQTTEKLHTLYERQRQAKSNLDNWLTSLDAGGSGRISFYFDGYEKALNKEKLAITSSSIIRNAINKHSAVSWTVDSETLAYRLVNTQEWYCAFLTKLDEPMRLAAGEKYNLDISGYGSFEATALENIISGEQIVNILCVNADIGELANVRNVSITVSAKMTGAKVETSSIINDSGGQYVELIKDGVRERTAIEVLAADGSHALIRAKDDELQLDSGVKYWVPRKRLIKSDAD